MSFGSLMGQTYPEFPIGGICLWSGSQDTIPNNWVLCDGNNGTPDLRDKFVVGSGGKYQVKAVGGEETHVLSVDEMPAHRHYYGESYNSVGNPNTAFHVTSPANCSGSTKPWDVTVVTDFTGNNQPHNNLPPYYALCYIMKVA